MLIPHQKLAVNAADIVKGGLNYLAGSKLNFTALNRHIPKTHLYWTGSARYGLSQTLKPKMRVGIPAFTCSVVGDAVRNADCSPVFFDSSIIAGYSALKEKISSMDALILPYNMGFIPEISKITRLCKQNAVELIEDCATSLGAKYHNIPVGSFSDKSVYSFNISKGFFIGGLVACNHKLEFLRGTKYPFTDLAKTAAEGLVAQAWFNKHLYPITNQLLQGELHKKHPALRYDMPLFAKYVIAEQSKRLDSVLKTRRENALLCMSELEGVIDFVHPIRNSVPSWLYFVLLDKNRASIMKQLRRENIDIVPSYTFSDLSGRSALAQQTSDEQMIFALHRPVSEIEYIIKKIKKVCR